MPVRLSVMLFLAATAMGGPTGPASVKRPVTSFDADAGTLAERVKLIDGKSAGELRRLHDAERPGKFTRRHQFERALRAAIGLWQLRDDERYRALAERACRAALRDELNESDAALCARVTDKGANDPGNFAARNACYHFTLLHHVTQHKVHAAKSAALLAAFAESIPKWPIFRNAKPFPQSAASKLNSGQPRGFWGTWMFLDIHNGMPLLHAYDLIHRSGVMQEAGTLEAIERMLYRHAQLQFDFGWKMFNCEPYQIDGLLYFAKYLGEPEWLHRCAKRVKDLYKVGFCADGWWLEGTASYHKQTHYGLKGIIARHLQGYTDPPGFVSELDGTRFDDLDMAARVAGPSARADEVLVKLQQPNKVWQTVHDTTYPHRSWGVPKITAAKPHLFGCTGHAILGYGAKRREMVQATLHFGGTHGHEHSDMLNLILWAKDRELISETRYRPLNITNTTREWHKAGAGHVTVVVDGKKNTTRWSKDGLKRKRQPTDDIPGVPDWYWRWRCYGNNMNNGMLRLFNTDFDRVMVVEADGERAYGTRVPMELYRRTIALVRINDVDCYVVDVFRSRGGTVHDYMLHSCLDKSHTARFSLPVGTSREGTLHKYITDLRTAKTDGPWSVTFTLDDGSAALKTFMLPQPGTEIILGMAPAMRRQGVAPFIAVRQSDGESVFVAVHHPYVGRPLVQKVEAVPLEPDDANAVAIRVTLPNRVDTIVSTADDNPWVARQTQGGRLRMRGRFAHVAQGQRGDNWLYLVNGNLLALGDREIRGPVSHGGVLTKTYRVEAGDEINAFVAAEELPVDGRLDGRTLMIDEAGVLVQAFGITRVERRDGETVLMSQGEPGMTITPGLIKLEYYPCWGIRGEARYRIAGSALLRQADQGWSFVQTGEAEVRGVK